jgi:hypothetical protein
MRLFKSHWRQKFVPVNSITCLMRMIIAMKKSAYLIKQTMVVSCVLFLVACGGGGAPPTAVVEPPVAEGVRISGAISVPGGTVTTENPTGLQVAPNRRVALGRVDDNGVITGNVLDETTSDANGNYVLILPAGIAFTSDLIVTVTLDNNETARAIVIDATTDITPITEYIASKLIDDPSLDLSNLPLAEVNNLIEKVAALDLGSQPNLSDTLTNIALLFDPVIEAEIPALVTAFNPLVRLSGLLSAPVTSSRSDSLKFRPVTNTTINLYRIDNDGNIIGASLASTTTDADGAYTLELPAGVILSADLIVRAEVSTGVFLSALVVNAALNIDPTSQYVFTQVTQSPDLVVDSLSIGDVYGLVTLITDLNIDEAADLASTIAAIDAAAGAAVTTELNNIQISTASANSGVWDDSLSKYGASVYQ